MVLEVARGGYVAQRQPDAGDLAGEELGVGLGALGDLAIGVGLGAVALLLTVLGEQDQRRGVGGLQRQQQGEQLQLLAVELADRCCPGSRCR